MRPDIPKKDKTAEARASAFAAVGIADIQRNFDILRTTISTGQAPSLHAPSSLQKGA